MPAKRKAHFKSRKGCFQCKTRHTKASTFAESGGSSACQFQGTHEQDTQVPGRSKPSEPINLECMKTNLRRQCNEEHPRCANCTRLNIPCKWPAEGNVTHLASPDSDTSTTREQREADSPASTSNLSVVAGFSLDDMQLLHRWTTRVNIFRDVPNTADEPGAPLWSEAIIQLAFEHGFLLHGILALSALQKTIEDAQDRRASMLAQADAHMSVSLARYRSLLENSTVETLAPMFILSSVIFVYNLASAQVAEPEKPIDDMIHCFRLLRGVRVVMCENWSRVNDSFVIRQLLAPMRALATIPLPEDKECKAIKALEQLTAQLETPEREVCTAAVKELQNIVLKLDLCPKDREHSVIMLWPAEVTADYLALIDASHPIAVIILVHFAVLLARNQTAWWLKGWLERLLTATQDVLAATPHLLPWLEWPRTNIGKLPAELPPLVSAKRTCVPGEPV